MSQPTQPYKKTLSGSVGAGIKSVIGGDGKRFYTLVHKVSSQYHKAGEAQQIIVDQIEIGRDPRCQVRFDESFSTVSRRHAAIVKDGDNWKLVQLSKTNSTYLNGHRVQNEWYLQNGDEIQLSTNGPKLGFVIPEGKKGLVGSIGLTSRLNLFRQQALRPYKNAIAVMAVLLVLVTCAGIGFGVHSAGKYNDVVDALDDANSELIGMMQKFDNYVELSQKEKAALMKKIDSVEKSRSKSESASFAPAPEWLKSHSKDVYWITVDKVEVIFDGSSTVVKLNNGRNYGWIATGFLLSDGVFVTARHCVEGWLYPQGGGESEYLSIQLCRLRDAGAKIVATMTLYSNDGTVVEVKSDQFTTGTALVKDQIKFENEIWTFNRAPLDASDYAYFRLGKKGSISAAPELCNSLRQGEKLFVLGYPHAYGAGADVNELSQLEPLYSELNVARSGLAGNGTIQLSNRGFEAGNSGGPIFVNRDGEIKVVAIVSSGRESIGFGVPISKIK